MKSPATISLVSRKKWSSCLFCAAMSDDPPLVNSQKQNSFFRIWGSNWVKEGKYAFLSALRKRPEVSFGLQSQNPEGITGLLADTKAGFKCKHKVTMKPNHLLGCKWWMLCGPAVIV